MSTPPVLSSVRRRAFVLLTTLLLLVLLITAAAQLATATSMDSVRVGRRANYLQHRLAVDSMLRLLSAELAASDRLTTELDRFGRARRATTLGSCSVRCDLTDDAAKLDVMAFDADRSLERKLEQLARRYDLPRCRIKLRPADPERTDLPRRHWWFDQLAVDVAPAGFFGAAPSADGAAVVRPVWSDVVTVFGDGRVDLRRVPGDILEVVLSDVDRSLARRLVAARDDPHRDETKPVSWPGDLDGSARHEVERRLTWDLHRYALTIDTSIGADHRRWYVVATIKDGAIQTHYRGQVQW